MTGSGSTSGIGVAAAAAAAVRSAVSSTDATVSAAQQHDLFISNPLSWRAVAGRIDARSKRVMTPAGTLYQLPQYAGFTVGD